MSDNILVSTDWLHQNLDLPNLRIVDIRGHVLPASQPPHYFKHRDDYTNGHIPGAAVVVTELLRTSKCRRARRWLEQVDRRRSPDDRRSATDRAVRF